MPLADQAAVGFDLGFARTAEEAEAAALALQVGPASHEAAALIGQVRELDLQPPFPRPRALAEDLQDQRRAVEHLRVPRLLQIALLHRRKLRVDDDHFGLERACFTRDLLDLAAADQCRRCRPHQRDDRGGDDGKADGGGQPDGFGQTRFCIAVDARARGTRLRLHMDDDRRARQILRAVVTAARLFQTVSMRPVSRPEAGSDPAA